MATPAYRIAINIGGGYVSGLNAVVTGAVLAGARLGWDTVGIRDGFDGLLFPDRYADGGLITLTPELVEYTAGAADVILGTAPRTDPFRVRTVNAENQVEEVDRSDELLARLRAAKIDAVISIVGPGTLSTLYKLYRKGLATVCVPKSVENDVAATDLSFGYNTALSYAVDTLDRARQAARAARRIGVVEVLGAQTGWLALQAGMAACADAVLIPEIPYDLRKVAAKLAGRPYGLVVVAEGATPVASEREVAMAAGARARASADSPQSLKGSLAPLATGPEGAEVIERSGHAAKGVALALQRLTDQETHPLVLGELLRGGAPTAVDRQLGLGYGAGAVRAVHERQSGVLVVFRPPDLVFVPLADAINKVRTVPADSLFLQLARALGMSLGD